MTKPFIANAAYEVACGRPGLEKYEVPTMIDEKALECVDPVTLHEFDSTWPYETWLRHETVLPANIRELTENDPALKLFLPESQGGMNDAEYIAKYKTNAKQEAAKP